TSVSLPQTLWHLTCHFGFPPPSDRRRILTIPIGHPPAEAAVQHILYIVLLHTLCFSLSAYLAVQVKACSAITRHSYSG
ncbi:hypothetical protein V8E54_002596, partial [Elaphomyces granulatus]